MQYCIQIHFQPIYIYIKKLITLAFNNDAITLFTTSLIAISAELFQEFFNINYFGVSNLTLLIVISTIFLDARYGIKKSLMEAVEAKKQYDLIKEDTPEKRALYKIYELKQFNASKLQYF